MDDRSSNSRNIITRPPLSYALWSWYQLLTITTRIQPMISSLFFLAFKKSYATVQILLLSYTHSGMASRQTSCYGQNCRISLLCLCRTHVGWQRWPSYPVSLNLWRVARRLDSPSRILNCHPKWWNTLIRSGFSGWERLFCWSGSEGCPDKCVASIFFQA